MTKENLWNKFKQSGKIEDYLAYKKGKQEVLNDFKS